ncbi:hypothetical protein MANES_03G202200v8 [Manihot esculenta]|uniref:Uncharacterized protein n=1 Tax=Manihot esculenta TaxID=3983 RepID=A0ACB7I1T5_MANES|nr:hypothetical protein MANES_03G202200v8 [Manihot esculenta]
MESGVQGLLVGSDIHGFHTLQDLDYGKIMEEASSRWLRPNEIHAILCNYKYFVINVKPVHLPKSGVIKLFDRKKLRNFRKDGHNWKKKKDGKTVKEAHEHLKVGNEERIHVYYAHGEDNPTFVRRCYWLLDKTLEHIVLVHYRETQEVQGSPVTPVNSNSSSVSEQSPWLLSEEFDSRAGHAYYVGVKEAIDPGDCLTVRNHEMRLHEINTLEWDELVTNDLNNSHMPKEDKNMSFDQHNQIAVNGSRNDILVTGYFHEQFLHLAKLDLCCVCGDACVRAEIVQAGVYRCLVPQHSPGLVDLFLSLDGHKPISQVLNFEYRPPLRDHVVSLEDKPKWDEFKLQMRLACLLFSTSRSLSILTSKVSPANLKEAKKFAHKTSSIFHSWTYLNKSIEDDRVSFSQAKDGFFELTLQNMLKEWLLERVVEGRKTTEYDAQGQGAIHLCALLGYTWAIHLFSWAGLSLDFRDKHGWTALHWAAYYGREKMVAILLSAGAKPNLVTDPTSEHPGGCTAADLASAKGYDGLAAYLSEKSLVAQFKDMSLAGNVSGSLQTSSTDSINSANLSEEQLYLKDTLAAYRTAADAAARIQAAIKEHSLKVRTKAVQVANPEDEARNIVAAMKIQHAFRNYETRKRMAAAARIQHRFRTWKIRKEFLNMRRVAIRIQAAFRGFQVRKQYRKIVWSVGVLEKAILRWRLKRKGFRGLHVDPIEVVADEREENDAEEDFFQVSRKQAEERVERAVVRVQAMFRSKKAQEEYRRMKLTCNQAELEYGGLLDHDIDLDR